MVSDHVVSRLRQPSRSGIFGIYNLVNYNTGCQLKPCPGITKSGHVRCLHVTPS
jgi:hypothetical protein